MKNTLNRIFAACLCGMALAVIVGCALTPSQQIVAAGQGAGQAIGAKLLADHSVNGTVDPAYLASYESEIPKVAGLMQGAITPADLHAILGVSSSVKLSSSQLAVVGLLNGVSAEYIKVNGGSTPTPDGALTDAAAKQVAAGLASAVGLVTGTNYTPPSS